MPNKYAFKTIRPGRILSYVVVDPLLRAIDDEQFFEVSQYVVLQR
ncbi:MAG TPA: hypothetical protein VL361_14475 [Candidatus Limnocylindrales bacterium]|nr:hypothetical protein [Candidatus Limnocylindrales bacterium]